MTGTHEGLLSNYAPDNDEEKRFYRVLHYIYLTIKINVKLCKIEVIVFLKGNITKIRV